MSAPNAAGVAEEILKRVIYDVVLKAVAARLVTLLPFLGWAWVNPVLMFVLEKLFGIIYEELARVVAFTIIDLQTAAEQRAYQDAVAKLKDIVGVPPSHWDNEGEKNAAIEKARQELERRLADLVRLPRAS